jgi:thioredoxin 1
MKPFIVAMLLILAAFGAYSYSSRDSQDLVTGTQNTRAEEVKQMTEPVPIQANAGSYETFAPEKLARAQSGKVVIFFRASWCPTCRNLDADIRKNTSSIPANVTILDLDYDTAGELKRKYAVTYQHTLVQVDAKGELVKKWTSSPSLNDIVKNIQ